MGERIAFLDGFEALAVHPIRRIREALGQVGTAQLCESDHYVREHFTDEPVQPAEGLPPAEPWVDQTRPDQVADAGWDANGEYTRV